MPIKLKAEAAFQQIVAQSGTSYTADAAGIITGVAEGDILSLVNAGCEQLPGDEGRDNFTATGAPGVTNDISENYAPGSRWYNVNSGLLYECVDNTDGAAVWSVAFVAMTTEYLSLMEAKLPTGLQLAATAGAGVFGLAVTAGTSIALAGEAANTNTKTDVVLFNYVLPENYTAGADIIVTVNSQYTGAGTPGTKTVDLNVYLLAAAGTAGADICATTVITLTNAAADHAFTITGTTLTPGSEIQLVVTTVLQETGGTNINTKINSVRVAQA